MLSIGSTTTVGWYTGHIVADTHHNNADDDCLRTASTPYPLNGCTLRDTRGGHHHREACAWPCTAPPRYAPLHNRGVTPMPRLCMQLVPVGITFAGMRGMWVELLRNAGRPTIELPLDELSNNIDAASSLDVWPSYSTPTSMLSQAQHVLPYIHLSMIPHLNLSLMSLLFLLTCIQLYLIFAILYS